MVSKKIVLMKMTGLTQIEKDVPLTTNQKLLPRKQHGILSIVMNVPWNFL